MIVPVIRRHTRRQMERILVSTEINIAEDVAAASHVMLTKVKEEVAFSLVNFVGHYHLSFLESVTVCVVYPRKKITLELLFICLPVSVNKVPFIASMLCLAKKLGDSMHIVSVRKPWLSSSRHELFRF